MPDLHNIEAEQAFLGALLLNNDVLDRCSLEPEHMLDPVHQRIFEVARSRIGAGQLASAITLKPFFENDEGMAQLGGVEYLARLAGAAVSIIAAPHYAQMIRDLYVRRSLVATVDEAGEALGDPERTPEAVLEDLDNGIARIREGSGGRSPVRSWSESLTAAIRQTNEAYQNDGKAKITTGIKALDKKLGGLLPGRSYVLAGRSSMGKTAAALEMVAANPDAGVVIGSFEMTGAELAHRMISRALKLKGTAIPYVRLTNGWINAAEFEAAMIEAEQQEPLPRITIEAEHKSIPRLRAAIRRAEKVLKSKGKALDLVVLDYLQLMTSPKARSRFDSVGDVSKEAKAIAREHNVPVVLLSQVNRSVEDPSRKDRRPGLSDLRQSGEIEEDADTVIFVFREEYYAERTAQSARTIDDKADAESLLAECRGKIEFIVAKNRGGPIGTVMARCDVAHNVISDLEEQEDMAL